MFSLSSFCVTVKLLLPTRQLKTTVFFFFFFCYHVFSTDDLNVVYIPYDPNYVNIIKTFIIIRFSIKYLFMELMKLEQTFLLHKIFINYAHNFVV